MDCAMEMPIGASSAADAVLDMNWVRTLEIRKRTAVRTYGFGFAPIMPTTVSAISLPAPVFSIAVATESIPAKRKIVTQSIPAYASFSFRQPVMTQRIAPVTAAVCSGTVFRSRAMQRTTPIRMRPEIHILVLLFGALSSEAPASSFAALTASSSISPAEWSGRKRRPTKRV